MRQYVYILYLHHILCFVTLLATSLSGGEESRVFRNLLKEAENVADLPGLFEERRQKVRSEIQQHVEDVVLACV